MKKIYLIPETEVIVINSMKILEDEGENSGVIEENLTNDNVIFEENTIETDVEKSVNLWDDWYRPLGYILSLNEVESL